MAKREDVSQEFGAGETGSSSGQTNTITTDNAAETAQAIQIAQAGTGNQQPFNLTNATVVATFTSSERGARIELPPGTAIDQVFIKDGNLYLIQPDGSVVVIVDGATNYPTLVIGDGLEIPADRLAEALENAVEGVPTAGPEAGPDPSSGGNFAADPGVIGGPFDLRDLLPPTALAFELFGTEDEEDELIEEDEALIGPSILDVGTILLEEDDLVVQGNDTDGSGFTLFTGMATLGVDFGSGGPGAITFPASITAPEGFTSNGEQITLVVSPDGLTLQGFAGGNLIFEAVLSDDFSADPFGKITFTLFDNLDHGTPTKDGLDGSTANFPVNLNDEEMIEINIAFDVENGAGLTASGVVQVQVQDDIPEIMVPNQEKCADIVLQKGVIIDDDGDNGETGEGEGEVSVLNEFGGPDPSDLLFRIPDPETFKELQIDITEIRTDTEFETAFGYYFADINGNPISGFVMEDNASGDLAEEATVLAEDIPDGAFMLGFFILPNANLLQSLPENVDVTFDLVNGNWVAFLDGEPIQTEDGHVLFSDRRFNPDIDPDGNTVPGDDFEKMGPNDDFSRDSNWEETVEGSDKDFNDVQFNVKVTVRVPVEFLLQVDEDDINNFDPGNSPIEGSMGTEPNDGDEVDGSFTGHPSFNTEGPAVAHANLGIKWGSDDGNMEPSKVEDEIEGEEGSETILVDGEDDGTEFFGHNGFDAVNGDTITLGAADDFEHDFVNGEKVVYTTSDPTDPATYINGLTPGVYYVHVVDDDSIQLMTNRADALAGNNPIDLQGDEGSGTQFIHKVGDRSVIFDPELDGTEATYALPDGSTPPLTSKGEQVIYQLVDDGTKLIAFVDGKFFDDDQQVEFVGSDNGDSYGIGDGVYDPSGESGDRLIFEAELSDLGDGEIWFKLHDQIDHPDPGVGNMDTPVEDLVWLKFPFIATDSDGDMVMDTVTVDVKDDVPMLTGEEPVSLLVDEDDINTLESELPGEDAGSMGTSPNDGNSDGSFTGNPISNTQGPAITTASLAGLVKVGSDETENGGAEFMFVEGAIAREYLEGLGLRSQGESLSFDIQGNALFGFVNNVGSDQVFTFGDSGDRLVFKLTVELNGDVTFELFDQMDHDPPFDTDPDGFENDDDPNFPGNTETADQNTDLIDNDDPDGDPRDFDISEIDFGPIVKAVDFDGDAITLDGQIGVTIRDDIPVVTDAKPITLLIDEDDINTLDIELPGQDAGSEGQSPNDGAGDGSETGNPPSNITGPAVASADLSGLVKIGADEEATFMFVDEGEVRAYLEGLGLKSKGESLSFDIQGNALFAFVNNTGSDQIFTFGDNGDRLVFRLTVDFDGGVLFELFDQMDHDLPFDDPGDGEGIADENLDLQDGVSGDVSQIDFGSIIKAVDFDGDAVLLDGLFGVSIRDDVPSASIRIANGEDTVVIDETVGSQNDDVAFASLPPAVQALFNAVTNKGVDPDGTLPQYARDPFPAVVATTVTPGADDDPVVELTLELAGGVDSIDSGIDTTDGRDIILFKEGDLIVGRYETPGTSAGVNQDDDAAFAIHIAPSGHVSIVQFVSVFNPVAGSSFAARDDTIFLSSGKILAQVKVTDFDGDMAIDTVDLGGEIGFSDDGPSVSGNSLVQLDDDDLTNGNPGGPGDNPNATPVNETGTLAHDYGADGPGSLLLLGSGAPGGFVYTLSNNGETLTISQGGTDVIRIDLSDGTSGDYTVTQLAPIDHPSGGNENNVQFTVNYRVTDGDNDTADGTLSINVDDDTPEPQLQVSSEMIIHDETPGVDGDASDVATDLSALFAGVANTGNDPDVTPGNPNDPIGFAQSASPIATVVPNVGADVPGTVTFLIDVPGSSEPSGLQTTEGRNITLFEEGPNLVVGRYEPAGDNSPDGFGNEPAAFAIHIDPATGILTVVQYVSILHDDRGDPDEANDNGTQPNDAPPDDPLTVQQAIIDSALRVRVQVEDADGDVVTSSRVNIGDQIKFQDDGPVVDDSVMAMATLDENGLSGEDSISSTIDLTDVDGAGTSAVSFGADGPATGGGFSLKDPSDALSQLNLTSQGTPLQYAFDGTTLVAHTGNVDDPVFTVALQANGQATFTQFASIDQAGTDQNPFVLTFGYNATDGDGDADMGTFQFKLIGDDPVELSGLDVEGGELSVDEDDLSPDGSDQSDPVMKTGSFTVDAPDGLQTLEIGGSSFTEAELLATNGTPATVSGTQYGTLEITGYNAATGVVDYKYTLDDNTFDHGPANDGEDSVFENLAVTATDTDNDSDTASLDIEVVDDVPTAKDDKFEVQEAGTDTVNALFVLDRSGSMDNVQVNGVDRIDLAKAAILDFAARPGVLSIQVIAFNNDVDPDEISGWFDLTQPDALTDLETFLDSFGASGDTNYSDATQAVRNNFAGAPNTADQDNIFFLSDGSPNPVSTALSATVRGPGNTTELDLWEDFFNDPANGIDNIIAVGIGDTIPGGAANGSLQEVALPNADNPNLPDDNNNVVLINEADELSDIIDQTLPSAIAGNVLVDNGNGADVPGADGLGGIVSITVQTEADPDVFVTFTFDGTDITNTTTNAVIPGSELNVETAFGGKFTFHFADDGSNSAGDFIYVAGEVSEDVWDKFDYTIVDGDGDQSSATLTIDVINTLAQVEGFLGVVEEEHLDNFTGLGTIEGSTGNEDTIGDMDADTDVDFSLTGISTQLDLAGLVSDPAATFNLVDVVSANGGNPVDVFLMDGVTKLTSRGEDVQFTSFNAGANQLVATAGHAADGTGGRIVFRVTLNETTGVFTFELVDQVDHHDILAADDIEGSIQIALDGLFEATSNSSTITLQDIKVKVIDDIPIIGENGVEAINIDISSQTTATGNIDFLVGADEPGVADLSGNTPPVGLTSEGEDVTYFVDPSTPNILVAHIGDPNTPEDVVFTLEIDVADKDYTIEFNRVIDGDTDVELSFDATLADADGDSLDISIPVTVTGTEPPDTGASDQKAAISLSTFDGSGIDGIAGDEFGNGDVIITTDGSTASILFSEATFIGDADVNGFHHFTGTGSILGQAFTPGDMLLSTADTASLPGFLGFRNEDVVFWDSETGQASLLFDGSTVIGGSGNGIVDAVSVVESAVSGEFNLVLSLTDSRTIDNATSPDVAFRDGDLFEWDGSDASLFFDEVTGFVSLPSDVGFAENVDIFSVHVLSRNEIIFTAFDSNDFDSGTTIGTGPDAVTIADLGDVIYWNGTTGAVILDDDTFFDQSEFIDAIDPPKEVLDQLMADVVRHTAITATRSVEANVSNGTLTFTFIAAALTSEFISALSFTLPANAAIDPEQITVILASGEEVEVDVAVEEGADGDTVTLVLPDQVVTEGDSLHVSFEADEAVDTGPVIEPGRVRFSATFEDDETIDGEVQVGEDGTGSATASTELLVGQKIVGTEGDDILVGGSGNDILIGGDGDDILIGGAGDDILKGGAGENTLTGGEGADTFVLEDIDVADIITDYDFDEGDVVDISALLDGAQGADVAGNLENFVRVVVDDGEDEAGLEVDTAGGGDAFTRIATLQGIGAGDVVKVIIDDGDNGGSSGNITV